MSSGLNIAGSVGVEVVADLTKLDAGLKKAVTSGQEAGNKISQDLGKVETATEKATSATDRLAVAKTRAASAGRGLSDGLERVGSSAARSGAVVSRAASQWNSMSQAAANHWRAMNQAAVANDNAAQSFTRSSSVMSGGFSRLIAVTLLATAALVGFVAASAQAGIQAVSLDRGFAAAAGSAEQGARELNFIKDTADRLGLALGDTAKQYMSFLAASQGTNLQGQATRDIFVAVTSAMTALGKRGPETERALVAVQQMMSKGKVSAEELRGQLGEALPGAMGIFARAAGVSQAKFGKMMEDGKVLAEDILPKVSKELTRMYGSAAEAASQDLPANINRLKTAWEVYQRTVAEGGLNDALNKATVALREFLNDSLGAAASIGSALGATVDKMREFGTAAVSAYEDAKIYLKILGEVDQSSTSPEGINTSAILEQYRLMDASIAQSKRDTINVIVGIFVAGYEMSVLAWNNLPAAFADLGAKAGNFLIDAVEKAVNFVVGGLNKIISTINSVGASLPGISFKPLSEAAEVSFSRIETASAGAATKLKDDMVAVAKSAMGRDYVGEVGDAISKRYNEIKDATTKAREEQKKLDDAAKASKTADYLKNTGDGAKKAAEDLEKAGEAAKKAKEEFDKLKSTAEAAAKIAFPAEMLKKQGEELQKQLDKYRSQLEKEDPLLVKALEMKIKLNLEGKELESVKEKSDELAKEMTKAFSGVFDDMFSSGNKGLAGFADNFTKSLAKIGTRSIEQNFLKPLFEGGGTGNSSSESGFSLNRLQKAIETGSEKGFSAGFSELFSGSSSSSSGTAAKSGGLFSGGLGGGLVSAGAGAAIGYQSQSPLMGAFGGALSGAAVGGPVGAIVGGAAGLIGGLFGQSQAKKERQKQIKAQLEEYKQEYESQRSQIEQLQVGFRGGATTGNEANITSAFGQMREAAFTASRGGDQANADQIVKDFVTYRERMRQQFREGFEGTLDELARGLGPSGPFSQATQAIRTLGESLQAFIADTAGAADASATTRARATAVQAALASLDSAKTLSPVETEMQRIRGTAAGLSTVLQLLGMSAEEAAVVIQDRTSKALDNLRKTFDDDVARKLNEAKNQGYLNEAADLLKEVNSLRSDARAVGGNQSQIDDYFTAAAQKIVDQSELAGQAFNDLVSKFPELTGRVKEFRASVEDAAKAAKEAAEALASRQLGFQDRTFAATVDTSTQKGALAVFDRQAEKERAEEVKAGGGALVDLEAALSAERLGVIKEFTVKAAEEQEKALAAIIQRSKGFADRLFTSAIDTSTLNGMILAQDRQFQAEREDEIAAGGEAILELERAQLGERLRTLQDYADKAAEAEQQRYDQAQEAFDTFSRSIKSFVADLRAGSNSPLSPQARLQAAQSQYTLQLNKAQTGDRNALDSITGIASNLLEAARAFYASSPNYQTIFEQVAAQLTALPDQVSAEQFIVNAIDASNKANVDALTLTRATLQAALAANSPGLIASALNASFDRLDTSVNGLLDYTEFTTGLGPLATKQEQAQARAIFNSIDADGDGQISKLEAVRAATVNVQTVTGQTAEAASLANTLARSREAILGSQNTNLGTIIGTTNNTAAQATYAGNQSANVANQVAYQTTIIDGQTAILNGQRSVLDAINYWSNQTKGAVDVQNSIVSGQTGILNSINGLTEAVRAWVQNVYNSNENSNAILNAINGLSGLQREQLVALNNQFRADPLSLNGQAVQNNMVTALNKIVYNTANTVIAVKNNNFGQVAYSVGGLVSGPGTSTSDSIMARLSNGEFVMTAEAVQRIGVANLDAMNDNRFKMPSAPIPVPVAGGESDMSPVVSSINRLIDRISLLEANLVAAEWSSAKHVREGVDQGTGEARKARADNRQDSNRPRTAGTKSAA